MTHFREPVSLVLSVKHALLEQHQAKQLAQIARDTGGVQPERFQQKLPGDEKALRGIPAIGRGVTGAINRTRPGDGLQ